MIQPAARNQQVPATGVGRFSIKQCSRASHFRKPIFVIEAKSMDGWNFEDVQTAQWAQSLFGKKFRFQNPLHQNYRHTNALQAFLGIDESKLISLVMFWG